MIQQLSAGIDIGGTNTVFGLVDRQGHIHAQGSIATNNYPQLDDYIEALSSSLALMINSFGGIKNIKGIGVGAPNGNYYKGTIEFAPNLQWKGIIKMAELIQQKLNIRTVLTNDANAAAIGEMMYGAAQGMKHFIVVTLGTGLGSGIVVNGEVLYGADGFAGELGHTIYDYHGRLCGCGRKGCVETYASASGIVRTVKELLQNPSNTSTLRNISPNELTSKDIYNMAIAGDALANEAFRYTAEVLGLVLADTVTLFSPEAIILFGGLANAGSLLIDPLKNYMENQLMPIYKNKVKIIPSLLPESDAAILGASALAWEISN